MSPHLLHCLCAGHIRSARFLTASLSWEDRSSTRVNGKRCSTCVDRRRPSSSKISTGFASSRCANRRTMNTGPGRRSQIRDAGPSDLGSEGLDGHHRQYDDCGRWPYPGADGLISGALCSDPVGKTGPGRGLARGRTESNHRRNALGSRFRFRDGKQSVPYLEIGLQTAVNHGKAGALLWMIGLDALLAAQGEALFAARLCRLLGKDTRIFPRDYAGLRPAYTVGELAADIYQIRNQIAHGDRIRAGYLRKSEFDPPEHHYLGNEEWSYQSLLCEAALFALCAALRKVIVGGHLELLRQPRAWKKWLDEKSAPP